jgi:hypothetical protein
VMVDGRIAERVPAATLTRGFGAGDV